MKKNRRNDEQSPELPLLWEQISEPVRPPVRNRTVLSTEVLEELSEEAGPGEKSAPVLKTPEFFQAEDFSETPDISDGKKEGIALEIAEPVLETVSEPQTDFSSESVEEEVPLESHASDDDLLLFPEDGKETPEGVPEEEPAGSDLFLWNEEQQAGAPDQDAVPDSGLKPEEEAPCSPDPADVVVLEDDQDSGECFSELPEECAAEAAETGENAEEIILPESEEETVMDDCAGVPEAGSEEPVEEYDGKDVEEVCEEKKALILESTFREDVSRTENAPEGEESPQEIFEIGPLSVGERLRSIRCKKDLTLQQVAVQLCTSQTNIEELENGHKRADHYGKLLLERLCKVYEVPSDDFLQDFIQECPSDEEEDEEGEDGAEGRPHRHEYVFGDSVLPDAAPRKEKMGLPALFLTVVIIGVLLILLGAWGRQKYQIWQEEQQGQNFHLDMLQLLPGEKLPEKTLPVPRG